ncbi:glycoside hydrolase family 127 protein [Microlunatus elymi]|uniref:Glycoside hydrolase family 127 protein n=1 Tax=Microlunatus elymi TaxID=2596828 RepID=A0A516Q4N9_9ACTN|nr:beta-L-arabinofuranosidase domain-containing protein [Microlunatus elymi]QDP98181.1 glycoside hydrolase family 127 protein [Microlunatus elymi]
MARGGPAQPTDQARSVYRPLSPGEVKITGGLWATRAERNRAAAIPSGLKQLGEAKNLFNLELAAGRTSGQPVGPIFADSDVYKWLEAAAWEYGRKADERLLADIDGVVELIAAAQEEDGYLNSMVPTRDGGRYVDLPQHHEFYCYGHLIQAAVATARTTDRRQLLEVAMKIADHLVATFGEDKRHDVDGHPVIEMALVELYRETGTAAYLELARYFVEARGRGLIEGYGFQPAYFSDRVPVREQTTVEGHAVRAVYLGAGATDVAAELDDQELLAALEAQFAAMVDEKEYLTGGLGSRWEGEAFGDPYELPPDRAYAETCAAIGGIQWAWRLLLATGKSSYADQIERMLYNGFLAGVSLPGTEYFYVNPLQHRDHALADTQRSVQNGRLGWFDCACCPPNVMRTFASLEGYIASTDAGGVQIHQYVPGLIDSGDLRLRVETDYPWHGRIKIIIEQASATATKISFRIPAWAEDATVDGAVVEAGGYATVERTWQADDQLVLELPLRPRLTAPDPRVDAVRGCLAIERGPLVYALEKTDQPGGVAPDDLAITADAGFAEREQSDLLDGIVVVTAQGKVIDRATEQPGSRPHPRPAPATRDTELVAIPYYAWCNRGPQAMRVWIPTA